LAKSCWLLLGCCQASRSVYGRPLNWSWLQPLFIADKKVLLDPVKCCGLGLPNWVDLLWLWVRPRQVVGVVALSTAENGDLLVPPIAYGAAAQ